MRRMHDVESTLSALKGRGTKAIRDGYARYGIVAPKSFGVPVGKIQSLAKEIGRDHDLALAMWKTGWYEARLLAAYIDEPDKVTASQMDAWCRDFDNWGVVDTVCFSLFDRTPHAMKKISQWSKRRGEFQKRAAFALLACVALHDKKAADDVFERHLPLIEEGAADDRNFVKKGVSWALRLIARRSAKLRAASLKLARKLASSTNPGQRWVGKDAVRDLSR